MLPQVVEHNVYSNCTQIDDVITLVDFLQQIVSDVTDETAGVVADHQGQNFKKLRFCHVACE